MEKKEAKPEDEVTTTGARDVEEILPRGQLWGRRRGQKEDYSRTDDPNP